MSHGGREIRNYLSQDKDIHVPGTVQFRGKLQVKDKMNIGSLFPRKTVFNHNITEMTKDTIFRYDHDVRVTGKKVFKDTLLIRNLKTTGAFANLSQVPLDGIMRYEIVGDLSEQEIKCSQLHVYNELNGMRADQFGHLWLSTEGDQIFSKHQIFNILNSDKLMLYGHLEEDGVKYDINNAMKSTYLTNRKEVVYSKAVFGK